MTDLILQVAVFGFVAALVGAVATMFSSAKETGVEDRLAIITG